MPPVSVAVVGAGAFGRNHLRVYRELETAHPEDVQLSALVEPDATRRAELAALYSVAAFASVEEALNSRKVASRPLFDAASICVPTVHHASTAEQLIQAGIDVLIEKPFATSLDEADRILELAAARDRIVAIGHLERFNPAVAAATERVTRPMFFEAHRLSIFTPRSLDVDVVLDLMIHDLDIVLSLTRSDVREVRAVGLPVLSDKVDIANVRIEFESGCVANFTASRVSTERVRKLRLFQPQEYLSLDFARQELLAIKVESALLAQLIAGAKRAPTFPTSPLPPSPLSTSAFTINPSSQPEPPRSGDAVERPAATVPQISIDHPSPGLTLKKFDLPRAEPLRLEIEDFLAAVRSRSQPRVTAAAGRAALALALEVNRQIAAHAHRAGLN